MYLNVVYENLKDDEEIKLLCLICDDSNKYGILYQKYPDNLSKSEKSLLSKIFNYISIS